MTPQQLNKDIKKLNKLVATISADTDKTNDLDKHFKRIDAEVKPEFIRLFHADREFKYMDRTSILIMLRLNIKLRIVAFHSFGLNIDETNIVHIKK